MASFPNLPAGTKNVDPATRSSVEESYGNLPLGFEANAGQVDDAVRFLSRGMGYTLFLTSSEAVLSLSSGSAREEKNGALPGSETNKRTTTGSGVVRLQFIGANAKPKVEGLDELPGKSNYLIGNDPAKWRTNVSNYRKVRMENVYPGIDLVYYGNQRQLEYDWIINPGANPKFIRFAVDGQAHLKVDARGNLMLDDKSNLRLHKPFIYQQVAGSRREVAGGYVLLGRRDVGFDLGKYDASLPLVIDPVLAYSTYLGGSNSDEAYAVAVDSSGNAFVTGHTLSADFPTANAVHASFGGGNRDAFVTKLNAAGTAPVYSTYLGGSDADDGYGIAVDSSGNAYVTGDTTSTNFPTANAVQENLGGSFDAFVAKLNAAGNALVFSTFMGGSAEADYGTGIAVDSSGNAYVTGRANSTNFPMVNALQPIAGGNGDAFVTKFNAAGNALIYSTYLGGNGQEEAAGIALDSSENAYITGNTFATNYPAVNAFQATFGGDFDAFVSKINAAGSALVYSTYLGGSYYDYGRGIAVDSSGNAYVTGNTNSTNFPTANPLQAGIGGAYDAFVTKISPSGTALVYSSYLGGSSDDAGYGIAADSSGNAYVTGETYSTNFPTANAFQASKGGAAYDDAFVTKFNAAGTALVYSTFLGGTSYDYARGIALDTSGNAYVAGATGSANFPTANAFQASAGSFDDIFVTKFNAAGTALVYSTYLGGSSPEAALAITVDVSGNVYVTGITSSIDFPMVNPFQATYNGIGNATVESFVAKIGATASSGIAPGDIDGDSKSDFGVWRPGNGVWYILKSSSLGSYTATQWGTGTDIPVAADYDGDGKTDIAVWRPGNGTWYVRSSSAGGYSTTSWGANGDVPVPADYDGDGKTDNATWRPANGTFYALSSKSPGAYTITQWGAVGDIPVPGDYDGDRKADPAVWRLSTGVWYVRPTSTSGGYTATKWGDSADSPVAADYDGDGKTDIAVWRPGNGTWYIRPSSAGGYTTTSWGTNGDVPVPADYDGDGKTDITIWRPANGTFYAQSSKSPGAYTITQWGTTTDVPVLARK